MDVCGLIDLFEENFSRFDELGASVTILRDGATIVSLGDGFQDRQKTVRWHPDTRVLLWSTTKALSSACLLHLMQQEGLDFEDRVMEFWPEYGTAGKEQTTLGQVLSHQAGQSALRNREVSVFDHAAVVAALAAQEPFWRPGTAHGYHARTYGFLIDELVRRIAGGTALNQYFRSAFGEPLDLDLWIGLPEHLAHEVAPIQTPRRAREASDEDPFYTALAQVESLTRLSFSTPAGVPTPSAMNDLAIRKHPLPSFGAIGTAGAMAKFYHAISASGILNESMLSAARTVRSNGIDQVLRIPTAFSAGFMLDPVTGTTKIRRSFGPALTAFGQPGAGGSHCFADPENRIVFAYVMNQMEPGLLPTQKSLRMVNYLYAESLAR
jgi:CubicO group peptidase (beta-lactamase class C family)